MKYILINPTMDFALTSENKYIFFSSNEKKYTTFISDPYIKFIINFFAHGNVYEQALKKLSSYELKQEKFNIYIKLFIEKKILVTQEIDVEFDYERFKLPELFENERYGYQKRYFKDLYPNKNEKQIEKNIQESSIAIVGLGSVGSLIAVMLASIGVGEIILIDGDMVELSNLSRQFFYKESDVNSVFKADSLKKYIDQLNSNIKVIAHTEYVLNGQEQNYLFNDVNLIIQTADKPSGLIDRYINAYSKRLNIPSLYVHNGSVGPLVIPGKTLDYCKFEEYLDLESNGLYTLSVNNLSDNSRTAYPTIVHGTLKLTSVLFNKIIKFLIYKEIPELENTIWYAASDDYVNFKIQ